MPKPRRVVAPEQYTSEQIMINRLFNGEKILFGGTGKNLPKIEGKLIKGGGLIKNGDYEKKTARMFGFKY